MNIKKPRISLRNFIIYFKAYRFGSFKSSEIFQKKSQEDSFEAVHPKKIILNSRDFATELDNKGQAFFLMKRFF